MFSTPRGARHQQKSRTLRLVEIRSRNLEILVFGNPIFPLNCIKYIAINSSK